MRRLFMCLFRCSGVAALAAMLGVSGCGPSEEPPIDAGPDAPSYPCKSGFLGDPTLDPAMEILILGTGQSSVPVEEGGVVPLIFPQQGGRVIFAGVRATNLVACGATLTGVLRDTQNSKVSIEARTVNLEPFGDGWGGSVDSDTSTFANIPVCPNQWSSMDAFAGEYELEVIVKDRDDRSIKKMVRVKPACAEPENESQCLCICKQGYVLGESCDGPPPPLPAPSPARPSPTSSSFATPSP